jgi:hypothetical protein
MALTKYDDYTYVDLSEIRAVTLKSRKDVTYTYSPTISVSEEISYRLELHLKGGGVVTTGEKPDKESMMEQMHELLAYLENEQTEDHND